MNNKNCESCGMPFSKDTGIKENEKYCSNCFKNGEFCYKGTDVKEFQKLCIEGMRKKRIPGPLAWLFSRTIPRLPRWKNK
jgi:hypothetical protein